MPSDLEHLHRLVRRNPNDRTARHAYADELERYGRILDSLRQREVADPGNDELRLWFADAISTDNPDLGAFIRFQARTCSPELLHSASLWRSNPTIARFYVPGRVENYKADDCYSRLMVIWQVLQPMYTRRQTRLNIVRGFIEEVWTNWSDWTAFCDDLLLLNPIRRLVLAEFPPRTYTTPGTSSADHPSARLQSDRRWFPWRYLPDLPGASSDSLAALFKDAFPSIERIEFGQ